MRGILKLKSIRPLSPQKLHHTYAHPVPQYAAKTTPYPLVISKRPSTPIHPMYDNDCINPCNSGYFNFLHQALEKVISKIESSSPCPSSHIKNINPQLSIDLLSGYGFLLAILSLLGKNQLLSETHPLSGHHREGLNRIQSIGNEIAHHDITALIESIQGVNFQMFELLKWRLIGLSFLLKQELNIPIECNEIPLLNVETLQLQDNTPPGTDSLSNVLVKNRPSVAISLHFGHCHRFNKAELCKENLIQLNSKLKNIETIDGLEALFFKIAPAGRNELLHDFGLVFSISVFSRDLERIKFYFAVMERIGWEPSNFHVQYPERKTCMKTLVQEHRQKSPPHPAYERYHRFANFFRHPSADLIHPKLNHESIVLKQLTTTHPHCRP